MKVHFWYAFLSLFFAALCVFAYTLLSALGRLGTWVPFSDFILMTLAVCRLVRLITYDSFTAYIRESLATADKDSLRGTLANLVNCPWCTGLWFALFVVFFYFLTPIAWYGILVLALAAAASFFQLVTNWVGWSAEAKKREVQSIPLPR